MQILLVRSGGFAGTRLSTSINTEVLPPEEVEPLRAMIESASFFELPADLNNQAKMADQFRYQVTIQDEEREHTVRFSDSSMPEKLSPLVHQLITMARSSRQRGGDR